jgi:hypothetical protein
MMVKLVAVQLETCHANTDGTAWYAYLTEPTTLWDELFEEIEDAAEKDGAPVGIEIEENDIEEVPNALSRHAGLRRFYVGAAV